MIAIFDWFGYKLPIKERYRLIRQAGFDGVMLWWSDEFGDLDFRDYPAYARSSGLFIENMHTSFEDSNCFWLDNLAGQAVFENLLQCVVDCAVHEIPTMIVHMTSGGEFPAPNEIGLNRMQAVIEKAEQKNVNIALENLRKSDHLRYLFAHIPSARLGFCYDSGHHHCRNPQEDILTLFGARLMALHLHDNDGTGDQHKMPLDGSADWANIMKRIAKTGFTGATALEVTNLGYAHLADMPHTFLQIAYERAKKLDEWKNNG